MKTLKIIGFSVISIVVVVYISFLFILPNALNLNSFKPELTKAINDITGLELEISSLKLKTTWNFHTNIIFENISLKYPNKKELLSAQKGEAGIKLLPLAILKVELAPIKLENPKLNVAIEKDERYDIEKYLNNIFAKLYAEQKNTETSDVQSIPVKISDKMPDIVLNNYEINLKDEIKNDKLKINGNEFKISEFVLGDKIKISTEGNLTVNNKEHCAYKAKIASFLPQITETQTNSEPIIIPELKFNPIPVIKKYNFGANLDTELKITQKNKEIFLKGYLNATEINYKIQSKNIDKSFLKLAFNDNKIDINSNLYVDKNEKFIIEGVFKNGKRQFVDLKVISDKIDLTDIQNVIVALTDIANIKIDLDKLKLTGYLDSNFNIKSDMKRIDSSGYLKIVDASLRHSSLPLTINSIKSNLDFNNNKIKISNTSALVNGSLFNIGGVIDTNANADIKVNAEKLPLNLLYEAFAPAEIKKTLKLNNGTLSLNAYVKGKLDKVEPRVVVDINNLKIKEKSMNANVGVDAINVDLTANAKGEYKGKAGIKTVAIGLSSPQVFVSMPNSLIDFDTKNITITPSIINFDHSKFTLDGVVKDYASKLNAIVNINGAFAATDGLKYIPKEFRSVVSAKGQLPMFAQISSDGKNTKINVQALATANNYFAPLNIANLNGRPSLANLEITTDGTNLKINDIALYLLNNSIKPDQNFKSHLNAAQKIAAIDGKITNLTAKNSSIQGLRIYTPNTISAGIPEMKGSSVSAKADININGAISSPIIKGQISVPTLAIPDYKLSGKSIVIDFNKDVITAKSPQIDLNGSSLAFDTAISTNFGKYTTINNLTLNADYIDVDKLVQIMEAMPQTNVAPSVNVPVIIKKGHGSITKVKSGNLVATNATGDFTLKNNLFKLTNMKANAYNGIVAGTVEYNIPYETVKANIQGRSLDSNPTVTAVTGLKDQMNGKLDFDANISMIGMTFEQQMKTLKGTVNFSINDGQMGSLGRLEHFIYASNLVSQKFASSNLNSIIQTLAPKNTGKFKYLKGHLTFANGWAKIAPIHSGGPQMSLYISGNYNLLNNYAKIEILGRVAKEIVSVMGSVGDMSVSKLLGNITKFGSGASNILNSYNAIKDTATISKIPQLVPESTETKQFQVVIDGNIEKASAVRSFKWVASEAEIKAAKAQINTQLQNLIPAKVKDFITPNAANTQQSQTSTASVTTPATPQAQAQAASNALKETAKNAAAEQLKKALPSFWDKIE